jgi:outer membrane protein assembly factor BamD
VKRKVVVVLFSLLVLTCTKESIKKGMTAQDLYRFSKDAFDEKKYGLASEGFKRLIFEHPGSELIDDAQFYLGESYLLSRDYEDAIVEFRFLIHNFPESPYVDDAHYKLGLTYFESSPPFYLEQTRTENGLEVLERFLLRYPESEWYEEADSIKQECLDKLAKKEFENGKLYYRMGRFESAEIYFADLLENYPSSVFVEETKFTLGLCYAELERDDEAVEIFKELVEDEGAFSEKAQRELEKLHSEE